MLKKTLFAAALVSAFAAPVQAQESIMFAYAGSSEPAAFAAEAPRLFLAPPVAEKDGGIATILSVIFPGAGQMYAGDTMRGIKILGGAWGAPVVGTIGGTALCAAGEAGCIGGVALLLGGWGVGLGSWVYGIIDAAPTTERMNAANRTAVHVAPTVVPTMSGATGIGVQVTF